MLWPSVSNMIAKGPLPFLVSRDNSLKPDTEKPG